MKMRVMLVDDEPFILQGLTVLVNWEELGYNIVKTAANGAEALDYLKENEVDMIIADIKMPVMSGLELLVKIREEKISDAYYVILSGYNDFQFAQKAIRYDCMDYILKPVQKDVLVQLLKKAAHQKEITVQEVETGKMMQKTYLVQNLIALLRGKFEQSHLDYVRENLRVDGAVRYVHISLDNISDVEELSDDELASLRKKLTSNVVNYLGEENYCIHDASGWQRCG